MHAGFSSTSQPVQGEATSAGGSHTHSSDRESLRVAVAMEELLASKLAKFLDSAFFYSLSQVPSSVKAHLYKGPSQPDEQKAKVATCSCPQATKLEPLGTLLCHLWSYMHGAAGQL